MSGPDIDFHTDSLLPNVREMRILHWLLFAPQGGVTPLALGSTSSNSNMEVGFAASTLLFDRYHSTTAQLPLNYRSTTMV